MGLNVSKGNMYDFITHTWNTVKGKCYHDCSYCYMKRWGNLKESRLDEKEFKTDLGNGNFIFVGSSCDMFTYEIPLTWVKRTTSYCNQFNNKYLFQTKNPGRMNMVDMPVNSVFCITLETNRFYENIMKKSPRPDMRSFEFSRMKGEKYITIEPIIDFDENRFTEMIKRCNPIQVNIGADSGNNHLPEPSSEKIEILISHLKTFTKVKLKNNLSRIYKGVFS